MNIKLVNCFTYISIILILACCKNNDPVSAPAPSSSDREKFSGKWAGIYNCTNLPGDTLIINIGTGDVDVIIALHVSSNIDPEQPEFVHGNLTDANTITIPEQKIGGFDGSGRITYSNNILSLVQKGLGLTCKGSNYVKIN